MDDCDFWKFFPFIQVVQFKPLKDNEIRIIFLRNQTQSYSLVTPSLPAYLIFSVILLLQILIHRPTIFAKIGQSFGKTN